MIFTSSKQKYQGNVKQVNAGTIEEENKMKV